MVVPLIAGPSGNVRDCDQSGASRCCDAGEHSEEGCLLGSLQRGGRNAAFNEETEWNYKQQINYFPQKENVLSFKLVVPVSLVLYNTHLRQRLTGCPNL